MTFIRRTSVLLFFTLALAASPFWGSEALAQSSYFSSRGCVSCHSTPVVASCNGCHYHGVRSLTGRTDKTAYTPGETVSVTLSSGSSRSGWIRAILYNQSNQQIAVSSGNASGMGGSTTFPAVLSAPAPTTPGTYTWRVAWFGNTANNGSTHGEVAVNTNSFTVAAAADTVAPVVGAFTLPATSSSLSVPVASLSASDNVAVTGYLITTSSAAPAATSAGWSASAPTSVTAAGEGSRTFFAWAKDAAGNVSASRSATVTIALPDAVAPVVGAFTLPATSSSLSVPVASLSATDNVGVTGYLVTTSSAAPAATAAGWSASAPTSVTAAGEGSRTFFAWAKDAAGNVSASRSATVTIALPDAVAPVVGAFTLPATSSSLSVPVASLSASDNVGVSGYLVTTSSTAPAATAAGWSATAPTSVTAAGEGSATFFAWAKDAAGNVSASRSATVTIALPDAIAPVVGAFTLPATAASLSVPISSLSASDNVAVSGYLVTTSSTAPAPGAAGWSAAAPTSVTAAGEGSTTFFAWAKDAAGNVSASRSATVTIALPDAIAIPPALTVSTLTGGSYTNEGTLNVSGQASHADGIQSVTVNGQPVTLNPDGSFSTALSLQAGPNLITVVATDNAGGQQSDSRTLTFDPSAPVITISAPADNSNTTQSFLTLSGAVSETSTVFVRVNNGSPLAAAMVDNGFSATVNLVPGVNTIDIDATDLAGNSSSAKRTVTYDMAKMSLAVTSPAQDMTTRNSYLILKGAVMGAQGPVTVRVSMDGKTYTPRVFGGTFQQRLTFTAAKQYAIVVTVTDGAGNSSSVQRNVIYRSGRYDGRDRDDDDRDDDDREDDDREDDDREDDERD